MNSTSRMSVCGLIAAAALGTSLAAAEPVSSDASVFYVSRNANTDGDRHITINSDDNGTTYQITIDGNDLNAKVDGKTIDPDRVEWKDGVVSIKDKHGDVMQTFRVGGDDHDAFAFGAAPAAPVPPVPPVAMVEGVHFEHPPVMVGINQTEPTPALRWQLGLDEDTPAILVERVLDGLPADKGGLHRYDVIVGIDGSHGANSTILHDALMDKNPGDTLTLDVISRGERKAVTLNLTPYDAGKLLVRVGEEGESEAPTAPGNYFRWTTTPDAPDADQDWGQYGRELREKAMAELQNSLGRYQGTDREQVQREIEQALKEQQDALREHFDAARRQYDQALELRGNRLVLPRVAPDGNVVIGLERAKTEANDRIAALEDRLDQLEERLNATLEQAMARIEQAVKDQHDDDKD